MPIKRSPGKRPGVVCLSMVALLWSGLLLAGNLWATSMHHHGCENPEESVQVCWDAIGDAGEEFAPFADVHLLPIAWDRRGEPQLLADYSRAVYRQFLPSGFADTLTQEWTPVTRLEEAIATARLHQWAMTLWISPRILRESSASSAGIIDWDIYLIKHSKLLRTMRVRVESRPTRASKGVETAAGVGTLLLASGAVLSNPFSSAGAVAGSVAMAPAHPPEAGRPLELMTEFAVRQILTAFKLPMERLESSVPPSPTASRASQWTQQIFTPK
ncbi:MAG: hypothetical protein H7837_04550 [Magnetococcus sp. MYC-9]